MTSAIATLLDHLPLLLEAQPEWGWYLALAWRAQENSALRRAPPSFAPWLELASLADEAPDATRLSAALQAAAAASGAAEARAHLLWHAGSCLPALWALALDDLQAAEGQVLSATPRFIDALRLDPMRATRRVERALRAGIASPVASNVLYAALVASQDAGLPVPAGIAACRARIESADRFLVDEAERYTGRLRLAARGDVAGAARLAGEAVSEAGADGVYAGLWSVMARCPDPRRLGAGLVAAAPATPTPEVLCSLLARCGAVQPEEVQASTRGLVTSLGQDAVDGRRAWPAAWRLLGAAVAEETPQALELLLSLHPPSWAVELATWRELRAAPRLRHRVGAYQAEAAPPAGPLESPPSPPWAWLPPDVFAARLSVLTDPTVPVPSGFSWEKGYHEQRVSARRTAA